MPKLRLFTYLCNSCVPVDVHWCKNVQKVPRARCAACGKMRPCFRTRTDKSNQREAK